VLFQADLQGTHQEQVQLVDLLQDEADALEGVSLLEDAVLPEEEDE